MTGCYYATPDTHGGDGRMQATKRTTRVAHLDIEHQHFASRDIEVLKCLVPLAAGDEFPAGRIWWCIDNDNDMRITSM